MGNKPISILCTRPVDEKLIQQAQKTGIQVDVLSFIETIAIHDQGLTNKILEYARQPCTVIFTSMNAVNAVFQFLNGEAPDWKFFCIANTTKQLVENHFGSQQILATANNAKALAESIIAGENSLPSGNKIIFFCGDQRRDELPALLKEHKIEFEEIVTYKTIETTQRVDKVYSGILFFSASAVHSYFRTNIAPANTVMYALGTTTANTISSYCHNKIVKGITPSKDQLLQLAIEKLTA